MKYLKLAAFLAITLFLIPFQVNAENRSPELEAFLKQKDELFGKKVVIPVEVSLLEVGSTAIDWELDVSTMSDIQGFVYACLGGSFDGVGKAVGLKLIEEGKLTKKQYGLQRRRCQQIQKFTIALWNDTLKNVQENNIDLFQGID